MLYSREALQNLSPNDDVVAIQRYFNKIFRKEADRLCPHEHEFLALRLRTLYKNQPGTEPVELALDPYDQPYLSDAIFKYLILVYFENLDFLQPVYRGEQTIAVAEIARDKKKFIKLYDNWKERLNGTKCDLILHEVKLEYLRKLDILTRQKNAGLYGRFLFERKCLEQELIAFYIYYTAKVFFRNYKANHVEAVIGQYHFIINAYTYVHIVSRHYIPKFNGIDPERSFNSSLPFIDPFNLPVSVSDLLNNYAAFSPVAFEIKREYMAFNYLGEDFIIWWKYKKLSEIGNSLGYEIRTLYKIRNQGDQQKLNDAISVQINPNLSYYYW